MGIFSRFNPVPKATQKVIFEDDGQPRARLVRAIERAIDVQRPVVLANIRRLRKKYPEAKPFDLAEVLEREYLTAVTGTGAAAGATAAIPAIGTVASLGVSAGVTVVFLEATALFAQSIAELHGIHTEDPERSKAIVMGVMLGEEGTQLLAGLAGNAGGKSTAAWGTQVGSSLSNKAVSGIVGQIRKRFMRRVLASQGSALLGRAIPFGIGAAIGGVANRGMGKAVIASAHLAFGPLPAQFPEDLAGLESGADSAEQKYDGAPRPLTSGTDTSAG
ncbi:hypothetical protein [Haematomicrobium sanguinis]|uniref:hypothetical protein n=1 Tax=Haematomicrobium sanguinis TaxID=479106 RepID=UPI00094989BB|nr:hypothetical protein [Haematomicrobium sanguinis]